MSEAVPSRRFPSDRYYDPANHLWLRASANHDQLTIGIDALGLEALGDLAYIVLPEAGQVVRRGEPMGSLEAAKMTGELIAPVSGKVLARNDRVLREPLLVNRDGYESAWLVVIRPEDWVSESIGLIHGPALAPWVAAEVERYRRQGWIDAG